MLTNKRERGRGQEGTVKKAQSFDAYRAAELAKLK